GKRGIEVAIGEEVEEDLASHPVDLLLRHAERLRDAVSLLEQRRERRVEEHERAGEEDHDPECDAKGSRGEPGSAGHRFRDGCQTAFRPAPITIESRNPTMLMTIDPSSA